MRRAAPATASPSRHGPRRSQDHRQGRTARRTQGARRAPRAAPARARRPTPPARASMRRRTHRCCRPPSPAASGIALLEPGGQRRRQRCRRPREPASRGPGDRAQHEVARRAARPRPRRTGMCSPAPPPAATLSRSASASGTMTRVQVVVSVGPPAGHRERQVQLRRRQPDDRRQPPERVGHASGRERVLAAPIGRQRPERDPQPQPLLDARASAAAGRRRSRPRPARRSTRTASTGSCRARTLWSILRRSRNAAWTSRQRPSSSSARKAPRVVASGVGSTHDDRRVDFRLRFERAARAPPSRVPTVAWYWTKTDR